VTAYNIANGRGSDFEWAFEKHLLPKTILVVSPRIKATPAVSDLVEPVTMIEAWHGNFWRILCNYPPIIHSSFDNYS
jgi:hypothetical protein